MLISIMNANNADAIFNVVLAFVKRKLQDPVRRNDFLLKLAKAIEENTDTPIGPWLRCLEIGISNIGAPDSDSRLVEVSKRLEHYLATNLEQPDVVPCALQKCLYIAKNASRPKELVRVCKHTIVVVGT